MNRDKQSKPARPALRCYLLAACAFLLLSGLPGDVPAQTQWTTATNGTDIYNTSGGNVGVGTNAPTRRLTVVDSDANVPTLTLKTESSGLGLMDGFDLQFSNSNTYIWNRENGPMMFGTNNAERLRITNAGNIGIGTNAPGYKLDVNGIINATAIYQNGSPFSSSSQWATNGANISYNSGKVGIGTSSPVSQLEIVGAAPYITLTHGNGVLDNSEVMYRNNAGFYKWAIINYSDANTNPALQNSITFYQFTDKNNVASEQVRMMINNEGNVGIGTYIPNYKLDVAGTINASAIYQNGSPFSSSQWATGAGNISYGSGNVGIGTSTLDNVGSNFTSLYVGRDNSIMGDRASGTTTSLNLNQNAYFDGTNWKYIESAAASNYSLNGGGHLWRVAGSGTAGNNLTWTTAQAITSAGNVGLGTTSPGYRLDVQSGQINASGGLCIAGDCKTAWSQVGGSQWTTGASNISYSAGNVGIGTAAPNSAKLVISGTAGAEGLDLSSTDQYANLRVIRNSNSGFDKDLFLQYGAGASSKIHFYSNNSESMTLTAGNVGIGTTNPQAKLDVQGNVSVTGNISATGNIAAKYQDVAEWVPSRQKLAAGTVVVLDTEQSNHVMASANAYDMRVAGVVSAAPGVILGEGGEGKVMIAATGRVKVKVDATRAPIRVGDLLVTGNMPGMAMKSEPINIGGVELHRPGTLIGKALEPLTKGEGEILVLLSLQ